MSIIGYTKSGADAAFVAAPITPAEVPDLSGSYATAWRAAANYTAGDVRLNPSGQLVQAISDHTAGTTFDARLWRGTSTAAVKSLTPLPGQAQPLKQVLYQNGATVYATDQASTGTVYKSSNWGATWTTRGNVGFLVKNMVKLETTATLLCVEYTDQGIAGLNPRIARSSDDGATWTTIAGVLNFPTLGCQSMIETPSGYALIGEYGNVGTTVYRIMRSTDDGLTWAQVAASSGTDPVSDPGHWHSITYDSVEGAFLAFQDRSTPDIYRSDDEGATWQLIGSATAGSIKPNFVAPMYFANHIAWAYDTGSPTQGCIARMLRADFYDSTKWDAAHIEIVAQLNPKSSYFTYPIGADTWLQSFQSTSINAPTDGLGGNSQEVYVVSNDGATVSGGLEQVSPLAVPGVAKNDIITFPTYPRGLTDGLGLTWLNLCGSALPRTYTAVPVNVGVRAPMQKVGNPAPLGDLTMPSGTALRWLDSGGVSRTLLQFNVSDNLLLSNPKAASAPAITLYSDATGITFALGGTVVGQWTSSGMLAWSKPVLLGSNVSSSGLYTGTGNPEGVVSANRGSLYLNFSGGNGVSVWQKQNGSGNVGWVPLVAGNPITAKTASYTMVRADSLIVMTSAVSAAVHLIDPTNTDGGGTGRVVTVKNAGAGTVTVDSLGTSKTIDGAASLTLAQWAVARLISDGTQWLTI